MDSYFTEKNSTLNAIMIRLRKERITNAITRNWTINYFHSYPLNPSTVVASVRDGGVSFLEFLENYLTINCFGFNIPCWLLYSIINTISDIDILDYANFQTKFPNVLSVRCSCCVKNILMKCLKRYPYSTILKILKLCDCYLDIEDYLGISARVLIETEHRHFSKFVKTAPCVYKLRCICINYILSNSSAASNQFPYFLQDELKRHVIPQGLVS